MAGFIEDAPDDVNKVPENPNIVTDPYETITLDSRYVDNRALITHVGGMLLRVPMYFSQYLGLDDETASQEISRPDVYQQYMCIHDLEMRATDALNHSQDPESREFELSGSATMYAGIIPNKGDMMVLDIGDGRSGIFTVSDVEQLSILRDRTYRVDYRLVDYGSVKARLDDLLAKTIKKVWYHRDFVGMGRNPFLVSEEHEAVLRLIEQGKKLAKDYYRLFLDNEFNTFLVPDQGETVYDPFLVKHIDLTTSVEDSSTKMYLNVLNVQDGQNDYRVTLWDAVRELDERMIDMVTPKMGHFALVPMNYNPMFSSIRLSGIRFMLYHDGATSPALAQQTVMGPLKPSPEPSFNRPIDIFALLPVKDLYGLPASSEVPRPLIHPVGGNEMYVLSKAFYAAVEEDMSVLEILTYQLLKKEPINQVYLLKLIEASFYWPRLEKFYYTPLLIAMVNMSFKDIN